MSLAFLYATGGSAEGDRYGLLLLVTDAAGNIVAQRGYNHSDGPGEQPAAIIATDDGGFAVLSKITDDHGFIVRKLSSDLSTELFKKRVVTSFANGGGYLAGKQSHRDGRWRLPHRRYGTEIRFDDGNRRSPHETEFSW